MNPDDGNLYGGISGAKLTVVPFHFGSGVTISSTFAHLMRPFIMAFASPATNQPHPGPWRPAQGSFGFDILAQIYIPKEFNLPEWFDRANTIWWLAALLRLRSTHRIAVPVISNVSFSEASSANHEVFFWPVESETERTRMLLEPNAKAQIDITDLEWVKQYWITGGHLINKHSEFNLAMQSFDQSSFARSPSLALLSLWGALEALFSPARSELRFRVSANIATFLEPPGEARYSLQKQVAKLYDERSAAAHGGEQDAEEPLLETYALMKRLIVRIIEQNHVPTPIELTSRLFGSNDT